jgi:thiamine pyrophosphokinase
MQALIVAGGPDPGIELIKRSAAQAKKVYCADRGALWAKQAGVKPDMLVGDMDSVDEKTLEAMQQQGVEVLRVSSYKDKTDTELCLELALKEGARTITLLGGIGGPRVDHMLANINLMLSMARRNVRMTLLDMNTAIFVGSRTITWHAPKGSYVSLFPQTEGVRVLRTEGLAYPIADRMLPTDTTFAISNEMTQDQAMIDSRDGMIMIIVTTEEGNENTGQ